MPDHERIPLEPDDDFLRADNTGNRTRIFPQAVLGQQLSSLDFSQDTIVYHPSYGDLDFKHIYLFDYTVQQIKILTYEGKLIKTIGQQGKGPGEFSQGFDLKLSSNNRLFASDLSNQRVSIFSTDGSLLTTIPTKAGSRVAPLGDNIFVQNVTVAEDYFHIYDYEGNLIRNFGKLVVNQQSTMAALTSPLASNGADNIYFAPTYAGYIGGYDANGNLLFMKKTLSHPGYLPFIIQYTSGRTSGSDYVINWSISHDRTNLYLLAGHVKKEQQEKESPYSHSVVDVFDSIDGAYKYSIALPGFYERVEVNQQRLMAFHPENGKLRIWALEK